MRLGGLIRGSTNSERGAVATWRHFDKNLSATAKNNQPLFCSSSQQVATAPCSEFVDHARELKLDRYQPFEPMIDIKDDIVEEFFT